MGHIRGLCAQYSLLGFSVHDLRGAAEYAGGGGSTVLRKSGGLISFVVLAVLLAFEAVAQPRGTPTRAQQAPALPPSGHQTEPVDLNEGKSAAELFKAGCAVCHQSAAGLAKGRRESELVGFLRQHYTSSVQHAGTLANFLAASGRSAPVAAPSRQAPIERPPAPIGRRAPDDDRREAVRPPEPASRRKPPVVAAPRTPPAPAAAAAAAAPVAEPETEPAPVAEPGPSADAPRAEDKPAAPEIPL
jgi:hypothetical protein